MSMTAVPLASFRYFVTFPCGIEDAVRAEFNSLVGWFAASHPTLAVAVLSPAVGPTNLLPPKKMPGGYTGAFLSGAPPPSGIEAPSGPICDGIDDDEDGDSALLPTQGILYFSVSARPDAAGVATVYDFLHAVTFALRTVDQLCVSLATFPMRDSPDEMNAVIAGKHQFISDAVTGVLSGFRAHLGATVTAAAEAAALETNNSSSSSADGGTAAALFPALLYGPELLSPLTDSRVVFRVNALRRDKRFPLHSEGICAHVGAQLWDLFEPRGWRVDMLFHNVEFFCLHDALRTAHLGLVLSPPPLPRVGHQLNPSRQYFLEVLRQRVCRMISHGAISDRGAVKALVPRPGTTVHEVRQLKGENSMVVPIAAALTLYADLTPRGGDQQPLLLLDPFGGSGTVLLEAWIGGGMCGVVGLCGEIAAEDLACAKGNLSPPEAAASATLAGFAQGYNSRNASQHQQQPQRRRIPATAVTDILEWKSRLEALAGSIDVLNAGLTGADMLALPLDDSDDGTTTAATTEALLCSFGSTMAGSVFSPSLTALAADATRMPYRTGSVDRVVSDMPFGQRCGNTKTNNQLYPLFLRECHRVLRAGPSSLSSADEATAAADGQPSPAPLWWEGTEAAAGRAVLLTLDAKRLLLALEMVEPECPLRLLRYPFAVEMGGLYPYVFALERA